MSVEKIKRYDKIMKKLRKAKKQAVRGKLGAKQRVSVREKELVKFLLENDRPCNR